MSLTRRTTTALLGAISLGVASPAVAQLATAPVLPLGRTLDGTLTRTDPTLNERGRFQVFRLDAKAGQRYSIIMRADDIDSYLSIARTVGGLTDYMASDDDGAGNSNARLRWTAKEAGTYYVIAQSLKEETVGKFTIRLDTMPPKRIIPPIALTMGETSNGELSDTDQEVDEKGPFYDLYKVTVRRGQRLQIDMIAPDFDSYLGIGRMRGDSLEVLETDDDGGGGSNARLRWSAPEDGEFVIRAQSLGTGSTGSYTIKAAERVVRTPVASALTAGTAVAGELTETASGEADDGSYYNVYRFSARAGESVTITMRSEAFDSYLVLGQMIDGEWSQITTDDDGGGGRNARIEHTFEAAGEYLVRANTIGAGSTGRYTIRLTREAPAPVRRRGTEEETARREFRPPALRAERTAKVTDAVAEVAGPASSKP